MREFIMAAMPFVTFGIVLAIVCVYHNWKEQKKARGVAEMLGYDYPVKAKECAEKFINGCSQS